MRMRGNIDSTKSRENSTDHTEEVNTMTSIEILSIIETLIEEGYESFGIRRDRAGLEIGEKLENSHQLYQDDPTEWGEEAEYDEETGMWDAGELDGTCAIGINDYQTSIEDVEKAIRMASAYKGSGDQHLYLIAGDYAIGGNDIGESIIHGARCIAIID